MEDLRNTGRAKSKWSVRWARKKKDKTNHCATVGPSEMRVCAKSCIAAVKYDAARKFGSEQLHGLRDPTGEGWIKESI